VCTYVYIGGYICLCIDWVYCVCLACRLYGFVYGYGEFVGFWYGQGVGCRVLFTWFGLGC